MISPELIRRYPFFWCINDAQQKAIAMIARDVAVKAGTELFAEGQPADTLYLLMEGSVVLCLPTTDATGRAAQCIHVGDINPGEVFGISAMLPDQTYTSTAEVKADGRVMAIDAAELRKLMADDLAMGNCLLQQMARAALERLRLTHVQLAAAQ